MRLKLIMALVLLGSMLRTTKVLAQDSPAVQGEDRASVARTLFAQGRVAYDLGNYDEAIVKFRGAYEQVQEPAFLFNIAQAYRLKTDCSHAVDAYRHFLRLSKDSENREAAETQLAELRQNCPKGEAPTSVINLVPAQPPLPPPTTFPIITPTAPPGSAETNKKLIYGTLGTGGALAAVAIALGVWNFNRYNDWSNENELLANPPAGSDTSVLVDRQSANDERLSSIRSAERINWALAGGATVFLATGIVWKLLAHN